MKSLLALFVLALPAPPCVQAQATDLAVDARVRVTAPRHHFNRDIATVTELRGDSIVLASRMGTRAVALGNVTRLDVSTGTRRNVRRGALIGLGVGALFGLTMTDEAMDDCSDELLLCPIPATDGEMEVAGALVSGLAGAAIGAVVGAFVRTERWENRTPAVTAAINPGRFGGVQLSMSRKF